MTESDDKGGAAMAAPNISSGSKGLRLNTNFSRRPGGSTYSPMTPLAGKNTEFGMLEAAMAMPKSHRSTAPSSLSLGDQTPVQSSATASFPPHPRREAEQQQQPFNAQVYYAAMYANGSISAPPNPSFPSMFAPDFNAIMTTTNKAEQGLASAPPAYGDYYAQQLQQYSQAPGYTVYMQQQQQQHPLQFAIPGNLDFNNVANFARLVTTEDDIKPDLAASYEMYTQGMADFATNAAMPSTENVDMNIMATLGTEQVAPQHFHLLGAIANNIEIPTGDEFVAPQNHIIAPVPIVTPSLPILAGFNAPSPAATPSSISSSQPSTPDAAAYSSDDSSIIARSELSITSSNGSKQRTGRRVSSSIGEKDKSSKKFICSYPGCKQGFSRNFNLSTHYNTHLGVKPFPCTHCPKSFSRRHDCGRHIAAVHSNAGKKLCSCGCSKHNTASDSSAPGHTNDNNQHTFYPNTCILHNPAGGQPVYLATTPSQYSGSSASISSLADLTPKIEAEG